MHHFGSVNFSGFFFLLIFTNHLSGSPGPAKGSGMINDLVAGCDIHYGAILSHHQSIKYSLEKNIAGLELALATRTYGRTIWDKLYRYPNMGAGYLYTTLGNREVFGSAHALFVFLDFPFSSKQKQFNFGYQVNFGLGYINRTYDVAENPFNMAISTGLNVYGAFRLHTGFLIDKNNEILASVDFSHFSNGKLVSPNLGLNAGSLTIGYRHRIVKSRHPFNPDTLPVTLKKHQVEVIASGGAKSDDQLNKNIYPISSLICDYKFVLNHKYALGAGPEIFYDSSLGPNKVAAEGGTFGNADLFQMGFHTAIYARYSRLTVYGNAGVYLYATYIKYSRIYTRVGFRYDITGHLLFNLSLKAHYANADYIELGLGYRL